MLGSAANLLGPGQGAACRVMIKFLPSIYRTTIRTCVRMPVWERPTQRDWRLVSEADTVAL